VKDRQSSPATFGDGGERYALFVQHVRPACNHGYREDITAW